VLAGCLVLAWCLVLAAPSTADAVLTEAARLAVVYDAILDARFDQADLLLKQTCPPAPDGACAALRVVSLWWEISINPDYRALDRRFTDLAAATIAANEAWTRREPQRAEAWFYLAGAYAPRLQWRILRGERIGAARDGNKIREALEQALKLDPTMNDAYFGIGLYHYYADVAPVAARMLRWLLFLPGGDRVAGLREMLQAREHGELARGESDFQLAFRLRLVREKTDRSHRAARAARRALSTQPDVPAARRRNPQRLPPRSRRQHRGVAATARTITIGARLRAADHRGARARRHRTRDARRSDARGDAMTSIASHFF
jgi:hypothetical protein